MLPPAARTTPPDASPVALSACTTCQDAPKEASGRVLVPCERVCGGKRPLARYACNRKRSSLVRERGDRGVGRERYPAVGGLEAVRIDEPGEERIVAEAPL